MPIYTATFYAEHVFATQDIKARTPQQALTQAHTLYDDDGCGLDWWPYDTSWKPLDRIEVEDDEGSELATWHSDDMRLRLAAPELLAAAILAQRELRAFHADENDSEALRTLADAIAKAKAGAP